MWGQLKMSFKCSVGKGGRIKKLNVRQIISHVFSMPRNMTQRNMGIAKELFLAQEKWALTNSLQDDSG